MTDAPSLYEPGDRVHYVSHGTPIQADGTQAYTAQCRAAVVTEVDLDDPMLLGLCVLNPTGLFFHSLADGGATYDPIGTAGGTWHPLHGSLRGSLIP